MRTPIVLLLLASGLRAADPPASPTAQYRVDFDATWTAATHPGSPPAPHFSTLVGGTHSAAVAFWQPGAPASPGIEAMAELGATSTLLGEFGAAAAAGTAGTSFTGKGILFTPTGDTLVFTATQAHPLVTLVTMVAPSPDWFVGVAGLDLRSGSDWSGEISVPLFAWDAGTDHGATFTAPDLEAVPHQPIAPIIAGVLGNGVPLGSLRFTRLDAPPTWTDLGQALAGLAGEPALAAWGVPAPGSPVSLALSGAPALAPVLLVGGVTVAGLPFKGGTLVPAPLVVVTLFADASGGLLLQGVFPDGFPAATPLVLQAWMPDAGGPQGLSASNAVCATSA